MTDPIDLNEPLFIERFIEQLYEAAGVLQMDAIMLGESGQDGRVWQIAHEELLAAAERIKRRTAGLPSVLRYDPDPYEGEESKGRPIATPPKP